MIGVDAGFQPGLQLLDDKFVNHAGQWKIGLFVGMKVPLLDFN